jgi:hypothetical protein
VNLGQEYARALAAKDFPRIRTLLRPDVDFAGLTPGRSWAAGTADEAQAVLTEWFEAQDRITALLDVHTGQVADTHRVGYRLAVTNPDGDFQVEQLAYFRVEGGAISWIRTLCSGYRLVRPS